VGKHKPEVIALLPQQPLDPNQILRFKDWVKFAGVCAATGWKMLHHKDGLTGPKFLRIGEKRVGIRVADHNAWAKKLSKAKPEEVAEEAA
jgi:predicted DNA-binding transcriptional regulator AlpA